MALSTLAADKVLDALCRGVSFSVDKVYIQLHTGDPGRAGTAHRAHEPSRRLVTFAEPAAAKIRSATDLSWTNITGRPLDPNRSDSTTQEHATHFTAWDAPSAGMFLFSGTVDAHAYLTGDTLTIPAGNLTSTMVVA